MAIGDPYNDAGELADYLKMTVSGNEPELDIANRAAASWVNGWCRRQFNLAGQVSARYFDTNTPGRLLVDDIGSLTDLAVAVDSAVDGTYATVWAGTDFQAVPLGAIGEGRPVVTLVAVGSYRFPGVEQYRTGLVKVTAAWGWPTVPDAVRQAALILAARIYKRRESAEGVLGFGEFGPVRVGSQIDPDVAELLVDYRLPQRF